MNIPLFVDNSLLSSVDCSTDLALRYIHGYTGLQDSAAMKAGTATHKALDVWFQRKDKAEAMTIFEASYRDFADEFVADPDDRLSWNNTSAIIDNWFDTRGVELIKDVEILPGFIEVGFAFPLGVEVPIKKSVKESLAGEMFAPETLTKWYEGTGAEFVFCGRFDMLVRWHGQIYVWENKSTGDLYRLKQSLMHGSQLSGYLWGAKKIVQQSSPMKEVNVSGSIINVIHFKKVPGSSSRCAKHGVKYSECGMLHLEHSFLGPTGRSPEMLVEWEKTALNLARRYRDVLTNYQALNAIPKLRTQGQFTYGRCPNCSFSDFCLAGKPMHAIDSMLKVEPWSPFDDVIQDSQNLFVAGQVARKKVT